MTAMLRINLLDWRDARREQRQRQFFTALAVSAVIAAGVIAAILFGYGQAIDAQQSRNELLQREIAKLDQKIQAIQDLQETRDNLITRMRIIENLQQSRSAIVHYFAQIVATIPNGVYLTSLTQNGDTTTIKGVAKSNAHVSQYMLNIARSKWFANPQLVVIKSHNEQARRFANFTLTFKTIPPEQAKDKDSGDA